MLLVLTLISCTCALDTNNVCTFRIDGKLFSMAFFRKQEGIQHYQIIDGDNMTIFFDFCSPFIPVGCP